MKHTAFPVFALTLLLLTGCGKQQPAAEQTATVSQSGTLDIMDAKNGYIVENAQFADASSEQAFAIDGRVALTEGTSSVLIIRQQSSADGGVTILALQFPSFATGSAIDYTGDAATARFHVIGKKDGADVYTTGALVSGQLRFTRKQPSSVTLGLDRTVHEGLGEMEISVSEIDGGGLSVPASKKYAAQFTLPIITLKELAAMNTAS